MSQRKEIIVIEPGARIHKEAFATAPMVCPYCGGRGVFYSDSIYGQFEEQCPDCKGAGEVMAMVTIDWKPNIKIQ